MEWVDDEINAKLSILQKTRIQILLNFSLKYSFNNTFTDICMIGSTAAKIK